MVSNVYQMPSGIPGNVTRYDNSPTIESWILNQTTPPTSFGVAVKNVSGTLQPIAASTDVPIGVLVRPYPTSGNGTDGLGVAVPSKALPADLLKSGYINVLVNNFAAVPPVKQGAVYIRTGNASAGKVIGNFEAAAEISVTAGATVGTGTQTAGTLSATQATPAGIYQVYMTSGSAFEVLDANNNVLFVNGAFATTYTLDNGLTFRMTTGGTPTAGDKTPITVTQNTIQLGNSATTYFTGGVDAFGNSEIAFNI